MNEKAQISDLHRNVYVFVVQRERNASWKASLQALLTPVMAPADACRVMTASTHKAPGGLAGPKGHRPWRLKPLRASGKEVVQVAFFFPCFLASPHRRLSALATDTPLGI